MLSDLALQDDIVSWTPTDDGLVVVLDMRTSRYLSLNSTGAALWQLLAAGSSREALVRSLADSFGLSDDRAEHDVDAFLAALRCRDLLREAR